MNKETCPHCKRELHTAHYGNQPCPHCNEDIEIVPDPQLVVNTRWGVFEFSGPLVEDLRARIPELLQGLLGFKK